jgi:hypothetical protein
MKWAKAKVIRTSFLQLHIRPDNVDDFNLTEYFLYGLLGYQNAGSNVIGKQI